MINNAYFTEVRDKGIPKFQPYTYEWEQWWKEQIFRCREGYSVGGKYMPGKLYYYINFWKILIDNKTKTHKILGTPDLFDKEWEMFNAIHRAKQERKGVAILTARGSGKSYGVSACVGNEFTLYPQNVSVVSSSEQKYSDDLMKKIKLGLEHLPWELSVNLDKQDWTKLVTANIKVKDENGQWKDEGLGSMIYNITYQDNVMAANGKRNSFHVFEEAGTQGNLVQSFLASKECWKTGNIWFGTPVLIGTGGDLDKASNQFEAIFYDPETYNLITFEDRWDDSGKIGFFMPAQMALPEFKDENGNTKWDEATEELQKERDTLKKAKDQTAYDNERMYKPFKPSEAFLQIGGNFFNKTKLEQQLNFIRSNSEARNKVTKGELIWGNIDRTIVIWRPDPNGSFRILDGEHPGPIQYENLYLLGTDPYDHDEAKNSLSMGSTFVYKVDSVPGELGRLPVAEYTGRPNKAAEYFDGVHRLCVYFNGKVLYENEKPALYYYFEKEGILKYLATQPKILKQIVKSTQVERGYGTHMSEPIKNALLLDAAEYIEKLVENIYFEELLREMLRFNPKKGNYDRLMAFLLCLLYEKEKHRQLAKRIEDVSKGDLLFRYDEDEDGRIRVSDGLSSVTQGAFPDSVRLTPRQVGRAEERHNMAGDPLGIFG